MNRKINWAIPGLLAMLLVIAGIALIQSVSAVSPDPEKLATQCSACHGMDEHVATWKESAHKDVSCTECHADPGVQGWVEMRLGQLRMMTTARRDPNFDISKVATEVPNQRCIDCHARQMPWVMQDLQPPQLDENGEPLRVGKEKLAFFPAQAGHDLHLTLESPLACVDCHSQVSHGPADRPEQVKEWHDTCLECHAEEKVAMDVRNATSCSACHTDMNLVSPNDHKRADFRTAHGQAAKSDVQSCQQCHLTPGLVAHTPGEKVPVAFFQTSSKSTPQSTTPTLPPGSLKVPEGLKDTCASCHGISMPHSQNWLSKHTQGFAEQPQLCATCHGNRDKGLNTNVPVDPKTIPTTDATCTGCHAQPMPHPENYVATEHFTQAKADPQSCTQCHSTANKVNPTAAHASPQFCTECHVNNFTHPRNFIDTHAAVALTSDGQNVSADCTTCHTETVNSCSSCHSDGIGAGVAQEWHPDSWIATHAEAGLNSSGQISVNCTECHTPTFNSCTECHAGGVGKGSNTQWHPESWIATHKTMALAPSGTEVATACAACHTEANPQTNTPALNACTECHSAGFGQGVKQEWHPAMFWITHARTTEPEDVNSCKSCHNYVQPSCAKCHRED